MYSSNPVRVGHLTIGGNHPLLVQSMCNTDTLDIAASVSQCVALAKAGCSLIRLTTQGLAQVEALGEIKKQLRKQGFSNPLVADVHFSAQVALAAAAGVAEKVRINPGNFSKDPVKALEYLRRLIAVCKEHGTALRIGVNHGSLGEQIISQWGDTPEGMCQGALQYLKVCQQENFDQVVVSLKSSNTRVMVAAYRLLAKEMDKEDMHFPLHLGITEAGCGEEGRLKSAAGIFTLLQEGLGHTLRVSLTEDPVQEVLFGNRMVDYLQLGLKPECVCAIHASDRDDLIIQACYHWASALLDQRIDSHSLPIPFIAISEGQRVLSEAEASRFALALLQATRCRFTRPEYISCPGCGRTQYHLEETVARIKEATKDMTPCTIAIMGCIVNGPGEMADADFGYVGEGGGKITLYKGKTPVQRGIPEAQAVEKLLELIRQFHQ